MIITRRCQLFEECVHRCRSADRRMPGIVPLLRPALMIRGIEPASEKNPPRTAMSSFFPTLPRVPPLPFPSYSFLPPRSINRPVFHSSPRCFDFEAYSRFRGRLEFRCFSKMEYLDGHFRRSSVAFLNSYSMIDAWSFEKDFSFDFSIDYFYRYVIGYIVWNFQRNIE